MASPNPDAGGTTRRGRPRRISKQQIVEAALEIGLDSFSIQGIADRLGVTAPALYGHVRGRDEIVELVAADLIGRLEVAIDADADWRDWLLEFGKQARAHFTDAASALQVDLSGPLVRQRLEFAEHGVGLLVDAGFSAADAGRALWLVVRVACTAGGNEAASVTTPMARARSISEPGSLPAIDRAIDEISTAPSLDTFDFDLQVILAGLERQLQPS